MTWMKSLAQLQATDIELEALIRSYRELTAGLADQQRLLEARARYQQALEAFTAAGKRQKDLDFELGRVTGRLKQDEELLFSGKVKTAREVENLQAEVESLKRRKAALEDALLEAMLATEEAEAVKQAAQDELTRVSQAHEAFQTEGRARKADLEQKVAALQKQRAALLAALPAEVREAYSYLQKRLGTLVVAAVKQGACSVCGIDVTPHIQHALRNAQLAYCEGCGRLLVV